MPPGAIFSREPIDRENSMPDLLVSGEWLDESTLFVTFHHPNGHEYAIATSGLDTASYWRDHVSGKEWITPAHLAAFDTLVDFVFGKI